MAAAPDEEALANAKTQYWPPPGEEGEFLLAVGDCSLAVLYDTLFVRSDFMVPSPPRPSAPSTAVAPPPPQSFDIHTYLYWSYSPALQSQLHQCIIISSETLRAFRAPRSVLVVCTHWRRTWPTYSSAYSPRVCVAFQGRFHELRKHANVKVGEWEQAVHENEISQRREVRHPRSLLNCHDDTLRSLPHGHSSFSECGLFRAWSRWSRWSRCAGRSLKRTLLR